MFTTYPQSYESLYSELTYSYLSSSDSDDITLFIVNSTTDEVLGVKKFYSTSTAELNIAPLVRRYALPEVVVAETGFIEEANSGSIEISLADSSGTTSDARCFTISRESESEVGLLSTIPTTYRGISSGEREMLTLRVDPDEGITVEVRQYIGDQEEVSSETSYTLGAQSSGFATFSFVAEAIDEESASERVEIVVTQDDVQIAMVEYIIIDSPIDPLRVAWISSRGSIEHYTFPMATQRSLDSELQQTLTLRSALENYSMRRAIAEIVSSPKVWVEQESGEYCEVSVESQSVELAPKCDMASVEITIVV